MKQPEKRETVKAPTKPVVEEKKIADKPAVVTPAPDKNPAAQPAPEPAKPHERYEHPERGA
jgi:hypothetical protein